MTAVAAIFKETEDSRESTTHVLRSSVSLKALADSYLTGDKERAKFARYSSVLLLPGRDVVHATYRHIVSKYASVML